MLRRSNRRNTGLNYDDVPIHSNIDNNIEYNMNMNNQLDVQSKNNNNANEDEDAEENVAKYIANCKMYDIKIDPGVVIALKTKWHILQPTTEFSEGCMLPLMGVLDHNKHIKHLKLASAAMIMNRSAGNGNSNARCLSSIFSTNESVEELDVSDTGIDDDGIMEICNVIKESKTITKLNLSSNHFTGLGVDALSKVLHDNKFITHIDLSRNALGFQAINTIECACIKPKNIHMDTHGNFVFEEIMNSVSHGIAFLTSIIGANILIAEAAKSHRTDYHFWACVVFSFNASFMFLFSTLFHSFFMMPETSKVLQILDHCGIYFQIAGSYTPILLIGLHYSISARRLLVVEWCCALFGALFSTFSGDMNNTTTNKIEMVIFLSMGAGVFTIWDEFVSSICHECLTLLVLGVACYVVGIGFFIAGEARPVYHSVWHMFVFAAAILHWFAIYWYLVPIELSTIVPLVEPLD